MIDHPDPALDMEGESRQQKLTMLTHQKKNVEKHKQELVLLVETLYKVSLCDSDSHPQEYKDMQNTLKEYILNRCSVIFSTLTTG